MKYNIKISWKNILIYTVLAVITMSIGILIGIYTTPEDNYYNNKGVILGKYTFTDKIIDQNIPFNIYWQVWNVIQEKYVNKPVTEKDLFYGSLKGMVASLGDPHSIFLDPKPAQELFNDLEGKFEGIGAEIAIKNNRLTVISPLPGSPAEKAGLKAGDKIYFIDDYDTTNITLFEAVNRIRGKKGTSVTLKVKRDNNENLIEITIIRDTIKITSVKSEIKETTNGHKFGYIKINSFREDTTTKFIEDMNNLISQGISTLVIDLRNNPGGLLDQAENITGYWIEKGKPILIEKFAGNKRETIYSRGPGKLAQFKTYILINGGTASGSEIMAGALQDYGLAILIGEKTFGKGSVQDITEFSDGSLLKLTIAKWLTPKEREIDGQGIEPNIFIELTDEDFNNDRDPQLNKVMELIDNIN